MNNGIWESTISDVGHRLKVLRIKKGFASSEEFSRNYGLPAVHYSKIENGDVTNLTLKFLLKILEPHNMSVIDFFCFDYKNVQRAA